jgi:hypothetical protein
MEVDLLRRAGEGGVGECAEGHGDQVRLARRFPEHGGAACRAEAKVDRKATVRWPLVPARLPARLDCLAREEGGHSEGAAGSPLTVAFATSGARGCSMPWSTLARTHAIWGRSNRCGTSSTSREKAAERASKSSFDIPQVGFARIAEGPGFASPDIRCPRGTARSPGLSRAKSWAIIPQGSGEGHER